MAPQREVESDPITLTNRDGKHYNKPTVGERAALATARARIAEIDEHLLNKKPHSFWTEKKLLQEQLDIYVYPVLSLPNEIISEIFLNFLPIYPRHAPATGILSPTSLGQVCRQWRDIAFSTPTLWRAISLSVNDEDIDLSEKLILLEIWLGRSRSYPLSIKLEDNWTYSPGSTLVPFMKTIAKHCARLEHLKISAYFYENMRLFAWDMPLLRSFKLHLNDGLDIGAAPIGLFDQAPSLRAIILEDISSDISGTFSPWRQLTTLILEGIEPHLCAGILNRTFHLVHCTIGLWHFHRPVDTNLAIILPLRHLESLVLRDMYSMTGFIDTLTLPALKKLEVPQEFLGQNPVETLLSFISRSGCRLEELGIIRSTIPNATYLQAVPSVSTFFENHQLDIHYDCFGEDDPRIDEEPEEEDDEDEDEDDDDDDDNEDEDNDDAENDDGDEEEDEDGDEDEDERDYRAFLESL
jgi:hypothetical protein